MEKIWEIAKRWIFGTGMKAAGGTGILAILFDIFNRMASSPETVVTPTKMCIGMGESGAVLTIAAALVFMAYKTKPPTKQDER